mgnify:CR=1 FL=1
MKITKIAVAIATVDGVEGRLVTAEGFLPGNVELEGPDLVVLTQALEDGQAVGKALAEEKPARAPRGSKKTEEKPAAKEPSNPDDISDADLAKAASQAADVLGTDHVKDLLKAELNVTNIADVAQKDRKVLLRWLSEDVAKAKPKDEEAPARRRRS